MKHFRCIINLLKKINKGVIHMADSLYTKNNIIGRLFSYFKIYFESCSLPTAENLFLIILSMLAVESADSIRLLYRHFLSKISSKSLNAFYYACSYARVDYSRFMNITLRIALALIPKNLRNEPVFLNTDDTVMPKSGTKFEDVAKLYDHAAHGGSNYLNGHCFVSLMLCIPVWNGNKISYLSVPLGYRLWNGELTKLELAAEMVRSVMPELHSVHQVFLLFDSWYAKKTLLCLAGEYPNLEIICNARSDSALYDFPKPRTGKKGRPAKRGKRLSVLHDFPLSAEKIGEYYTGCRKVMTNLFGDYPVYAYVTAPARTADSRRLFFCTVVPARIRISCAWYEKALLNQTGCEWMQYIPLFLYSVRWNIEVSYYEQKTFWSLCAYMLRSRKGIEHFVNLVNIAYCAMKILPFQNEKYAPYKMGSVQECRFLLSEQIKQQVFFATFVKNVETAIKSNALLKAIKSVLLSFGYHG